MFFQAAHHGLIVRIAGTCACIDDDVDSGQLMLVKPERLPDQALDTVASHSVADHSCGDRQAEPRRGCIIGTDEDRELTIGETSRIFVDAIEIRFVMEALRRSERPGGCLQVTVRTASD